MKKEEHDCEQCEKDREKEEEFYIELKNHPSGSKDGCWRVSAPRA